MAWPRKPPRNTRCDAVTGWHPDPYGQPHLDRCPHDAVETVRSPTLSFEVYLCTSCAESMAAAGKILRNPRVHPES